MDFRAKVKVDSAAEAEQQLQLFVRLQHLQETRTKQRAARAHTSASISICPGNVLPNVVTANIGDVVSGPPDLPSAPGITGSEQGLSTDEGALTVMEWEGDSHNNNSTYLSQATHSSATSAVDLGASGEGPPDQLATTAFTPTTTLPPDPRSVQTSVDGSMVGIPGRSLPQDPILVGQAEAAANASTEEVLKQEPPAFVPLAGASTHLPQQPASLVGLSSLPIESEAGRPADCVDVVTVPPVFAPRYLLRTTSHVNRLQPSMQISDPGWAPDLAAVSALVQPRLVQGNQDHSNGNFVRQESLSAPC